MIDGEARERILIEVSLGKPAPAHEPADEREFRRTMEREVGEIIARGHGIDIPSEIP
jgi:hypothetical protein